MMKIIIIIFVLFQVCHCISEESELKHVHILFRHGDRSPIHIYPNNKNNINIWPDGLGQLTEKGIVEQFQLGTWFRRRYSNFIGSHMNYTSIYVRSTDVDRTLMSVESNMAGLFFNYSKEVIKGLKWYPVPVHTVAMDSDILLNVHKCPLVEQLQKSFYSSDYFQKKLLPFRPLLELMKMNTGIKNLTFIDAWRVYDDLFCDKQHNMTLDNWISENVWQQIVDLNNISWEVINNEQVSKLSTGYLLGEIIKNFKSVISGDSEKTDSKMVIYSAHDTNIAPLAVLLGIYNNLQPPYCSALMMELHYVPTRADKWAVKIFYKNYTDSSGVTNISALLIPGCNSTLCHWSTFLKITKSKILSEREFNDTCFPPNRIVLIIQIIFAVLATAVLIFIVCMFFIQLSRKKKSHKYSKIEALQ